MEYRDGIEWDMELTATPLIIQGLLKIVYPTRDDSEEAFSYSFEERSCDTIRLDMLMVIYWFKYIFQPECCKTNIYN